jgi:hypothetical protein
VNGIPAFAWSQADSQAISYDSGQGAWHAGCVRDVLVTAGGNVIAATDTGGIWSVSEAGDGVCLADTDKPNMICLAQGPLGADHVFAGGETLFETDLSQALPLLSWADLNPTLATGQSVGDQIYRIVVLQAQRLIVIATSTGVYWASIPSFPSSGCLGALLGLGGVNTTRPAYQWIAATGLPVGPYGGLALGIPGSSGLQQVIAAAWGNANPGGDLYGLFVGDWQLGGGLNFQRAQSIAGVDPAKMCFTVMASHAQDPGQMYASSSDPFGNMLGLLRSQDGGQNWTALPGVLTNPPPAYPNLLDACTGAGNYPDRPNNAVAAGATAAEGRVAVGWRNGPHLSSDGGLTFTYFDGHVSDHLHADIRGLHFDTSDRDGQRLFIGSDGGVAMTPDFGGTFASSYNRELLNLQMNGYGTSTPTHRYFYGSLGVSPAVTGLVATGTQDNGNLVCQLKAPGSAWTWGEGGDGQVVSFLANNSIFHYYHDDNRGQLALWTGSQVQQIGIIPYEENLYLTAPFFERVERPEWRDPIGQLMYGVAASAQNVYGLVGEANAGDTHWRYLGAPPIGLQYVSAVSSRSGSPVLAGSAGGRIFRLYPVSDLDVEEMTVVPLGNAGVDESRVIGRIVIANDKAAFASFNRADQSTGSVLRWDGTAWATVPGDFPNEFIYAMEIDTTGDGTGLGPVVYLTTDAKVYASADLGSTWQDVSAGLPKRPHCSDLRLVQDDDGTHLYLSTYGRSLWRADLVTLITVRPT